MCANPDETIPCFLFLVFALVSCFALVFLKLWFIANISKTMQDIGLNPRAKMERIGVSMQPCRKDGMVFAH